MNLKISSVLALALVFLRCACSAQLAPIDGFLGVPWGSNRATVIATVAARPDTKRETQFDKANVIFFSGGQVAGQDVLLYVFRFAGDQFASASVVFKTNERNFLECYSQVTGLLQEKYGKPTQDTRLYKYPYDKVPRGSFDEATAFKAGKGLFLTGWEMPSSKQKDAVVWCTIGDDLSVKLTYQKEALQKQLDREQRSKLKDEL